MLVPGFTVRELPVGLTNLNNVEFLRLRAAAPERLRLPLQRPRRGPRPATWLRTTSSRRWGCCQSTLPSLPRGDLVVCCHSEPPDWGAGPAAPDRVFKISFTAPDAPQPVAAWPASETSTVVAFDRPVDATAWRDAARLTRIEAGRAVGPADRLETPRRYAPATRS
jgi:hypothetical protein